MPWETRFLEALTLNIEIEDYRLHESRRPMTGAQEGDDVTD